MKLKEMDCYDKNAHILLLYKTHTLLLNEKLVIGMNCRGKDAKRACFSHRCARLSLTQCLYH